MCCWNALWPERCGSGLWASGGSWFLTSGVVADDPRVLLLDELAAEQVPQGLRPLWTHLRLLLLESLWCW